MSCLSPMLRVPKGYCRWELSKKTIYDQVEGKTKEVTYMVDHEKEGTLKEKAIIKVGDVIVDVNNGANFSTDVSIGKLFVSGNDITDTNALTSVDKTLTINGSHKTPTVESLAETEVKVAENSDEKFRDAVIADDVKEISQNHIDAYGKPKEQHPDIEFAEPQSIIGDDAVVSERMIIVSINDSKKTAKTVSETHIGNEDDKKDRK